MATTPAGDSPAAQAILDGRTALGIEFGSTRIKAVLIGPDHMPLATGGHTWESQCVDGVWTYPLSAVWDGLRACYASLAQQVTQRYATELTRVGAIGVSAMMHGYLAFDAADELLVPFRTWRNTNTGPAADRLTELFGAHIPQRWSVAHLLQAIIDGEEHVARVAHLNTLAGYVHSCLTGERVVGIGDASGMFPVDNAAHDFDQDLLARFDAAVAAEQLPWRLADVLPTVLVAGQPAGRLTEAGAQLLDPSGKLCLGIPFCPPEGDAGTGMVATNSVAPRTGNVSVGTSIFAMLVLDEPLREVHQEIDVVATPAGAAVAMVHCNNGANEIDAWAGVFGEFAAAAGFPVPTARVFEALMRSALVGEPDGGGLLAYNYLAGEELVGLAAGRPLLTRGPDARLTLANLMRAQVFAAVATLRMGMDILTGEEGVRVDAMFAHGGLLTTEGTAEHLLAAALDAPVSVGQSAGEGGAWGIAVLAAYARDRSGLAADDPAALTDFLNSAIGPRLGVRTVAPEPADVAGFAAYLRRFRDGLAIQRAAITALG